MCANYHSARTAFIEACIAEDIQGDVFADREVYPGGKGPVILLDKETGKRRCEPGIFGLVPHWVRTPQEAKQRMRGNYNARSETVAQKPSFKAAWQHGNFCLIPVRNIYEPRYTTETDSERWSIARNDAPDFCIAGIYWRPKGEGLTEGLVTFSMLTMNCDGNEILSLFHAPADEKRSIVHVLPDEYDAWLTATTELARVMLTLPEADKLAIAPAPRPPRTKKTAETET